MSNFDEKIDVIGMAIDIMERNRNAIRIYHEAIGKVFPLLTNEEARQILMDACEDATKVLCNEL